MSVTLGSRRCGSSFQLVASVLTDVWTGRPGTVPRDREATGGMETPRTPPNTCFPGRYDLSSCLYGPLADVMTGNLYERNLPPPQVPCMSTVCTCRSLLANIAARCRAPVSLIVVETAELPFEFLSRGLAYWTAPLKCQSDCLVPLKLKDCR